MFNKKEKRQIILWLFIATLCITMYLVLSHLALVWQVLTSFLALFSPFVGGFVMAYLLNLPMKFLEEKLLVHIKWLKIKPKRVLSLVLTLTLLVLFLVGIFSVAIPQLGESIGILIDNSEGYIQTARSYLDELNGALNLNLGSEVTDKLLEIWNGLISSVSSIVMGVAETLMNTATAVLSGIFSFIIGFVLAIYMLSNKEYLIGVMIKLTKAFLPQKVRDVISLVLDTMNKSFENFFKGQVTEALIIGTICFITMTIFGFDYALLISVFVAITNVIPIIGPYIGFIPSFFILLMVSLPQALWFALFILILQQVEGNIIYPRVVGTTMGLSGFWVLAAVIIGNSAFGIIGIILGIPMFSTLYILMKRVVDRRLIQQAEEH